MEIQERCLIVNDETALFRYDTIISCIRIFLAFVIDARIGISLFSALDKITLFISGNRERELCEKHKGSELDRVELKGALKGLKDREKKLNQELLGLEDENVTLQQQVSL